MCGILGSINYLPDKKSIQEVDKLLHHRGPDAGGEWVDRSIPVWLFHRRLSIQDLSERGAQPMVHPDRPKIVITYNGEIYNARALREQLEDKGCVFRGTSDTEVLLHAYAVWDVDLLSRIEGMYAFAIWDGYRQKCFLARDPVGQKPLYYTVWDENLAFGSTPQALRIIDPRPATISYEALCSVLTLGYVPAPLAVWEGMQALCPGHYMVWTPGESCTPRQFWSPPDRVDGTPDTPEGFASFFTDICKEHLIADVPVGLLLSGGLDSTCMASLLSRAGIADLKTFTLHFVDEPRSEAPLAQETARYLGLDNITVDLIPEDVDNLRNQVAISAAQPQGYSALLTWHHLSREVVRHFKTVLSADGGDELFGGYVWYDERLFTLIRLKKAVRSLISKESAGMFATFAGKSSLHAHAMKVFPRFLPEEAALMFAPLGRGFDDEAMLAPLRKHWIKDLPSQNALQRVDLMTFCSGSICAKTDNMSMAHSLEVRAPFLDRRMIDRALSQPTPLYRPGHGKQLIRRSIAGKVPDRVLNHPKQGFSMKTLHWYDFDKLEVEIRNSLMFRHGLLAEDFQKLLAPGIPYRTARAWTLSALSKWYEHNAKYGN
ncbi:asparagine synthase (glutamine-hydrolysing) [Desulfonatronum thiosulfatophilum]|uniref:asparagine synthase (glutamine-hydrolyzing) n=1 Tax=Desulfonatronum thiosulfatophilum TaxID=617002 RepID=A0A1G6EBU5_9BACT|nr:asparagine synthase (glutamine-hydrolyzing) [Desulfonatronum thiosulfatophilum]SDB54939.1 asparagine synthase (glutamine-hydrolysing) [Desulfonatronum thiosulfatophilum]